MAKTGDLKKIGNPNLSEPSGLDAPIKMDRVISLNNESQKGNNFRNIYVIFLSLENKKLLFL